MVDMLHRAAGGSAESRRSRWSEAVRRGFALALTCRGLHEIIVLSKFGVDPLL